MPLVRKPPPTIPPAAPPADADKLVHGTTEERWAAARAFDDVALLGAALTTEAEPSVREAILTSLCRIATPESAAMIVPGVRSDDAGVRRAALDALTSMPQAAAPHLEALLADPDSDVRLLACEIVRMLPARDATALLGHLLGAETEPNVCTAAVDVLAEIGDAGALGPLRQAAARFAAEPFLQFAVVAAIERIEAASERG